MSTSTTIRRPAFVVKAEHTPDPERCVKALLKLLLAPAPQPPDPAQGGSDHPRGQA